MNRNRKSPGRNIDYISSEEIEKLKVKLVVQTGCSLWPAETSEELGKIIVRLTKSVAERPFKYTILLILVVSEKLILPF